MITAAYLQDAVRDGHARGWSYTPLNGKVPRDRSWQAAPREALEQALAWAAVGNVGVRCGEPSGGLVVVDVDVAKGGTIEGLDLPATVTVETGGGGLHLYYRTGERVGNSAGRLAPHVDTRGTGGQVVAPGSVHPETGAVYEYRQGAAPWDVPVAELPTWVVTALKPPPAAPKPAAAANGPHVAGDDRYAASALKAEMKRVSEAREGNRNVTLNLAAFKLGQFVGAGRLQRHDVEAALLQVTDLPEREARATIRSGLDAGTANPRPPEAPRPKRERVKMPPPPPVDGPAPAPPPPAALPAATLAPAASAAGAPGGGPPPVGLYPGVPTGKDQPDPSRLTTDLGLSERLIKRHGGNLRYVEKFGKWFEWDGARWNENGYCAVIEYAKATALSIFNEAAEATSESVQRALSDFALKCQSRDRVSAAEFMCRGRLKIAPSAFDSNPWLLNVANGTVDLRTGELRPHRREDMITRQAPVAYDPAAACPRWLRFLEEVLPDPEVRLFVQRWLGYSCTGDVREQYLPLFVGEGNNGKSVLVDTVSAVLGSYASEAPPDMLTAGVGGGSDHPTDIADLMGRRFVVASETEAYARLRVQLMKRLTGNAKLKGRYMRQDFFEFERTHKLVLVTNNEPAIPETTEAVWRRIRMVRFDVIVPGARVDKSLMHKLRPEHPGILAWLVRGAVEWLREGLTEPEAVLAATQTYRNRSDSFAEFAAEFLRLEEGAFAASDELKKTYDSWCKNTGNEQLPPRTFRDRLVRMGALPAKTSAKRGWEGLRCL